MSKKVKIHSAQEQLFTEPKEYSEPTTWRDIDDSAASTSPYPIHKGPEGSYVDIAERADLLHSSLLALGKRNQRLGFDVASTHRPYSPPIWGRYEEFTPLVIEGAQRNANNYLDIAKQDFWKATGFSALRGSGLVREAEIDSRGRKMWREYSEKYGDPSKRKARDKFKRHLKKVSNPKT